MGTKAEWREGGYLRFKDAAMFKSVASISTNLRSFGPGCDSSALVVSCPIYAGTFTTQRNMSFRAKVAGIAASSTSQMIATLRYDTKAILQVTVPTTAVKFKAYDNPYSFEFVGRIANASSLGNITATCVAMMGETIKGKKVQGTTGSTAGGGVKMSTSDINFKPGSTLGLNILLSMESTQGVGAANPTISGFTNTVGYIELFSG